MACVGRTRTRLVRRKQGEQKQQTLHLHLIWPPGFAQSHGRAHRSVREERARGRQVAHSRQTHQAQGDSGQLASSLVRRRTGCLAGGQSKTMVQVRPKRGTQVQRKCTPFPSWPGRSSGDVARQEPQAQQGVLSCPRGVPTLLLYANPKYESHTSHQRGVCLGLSLPHPQVRESHPKGQKPETVPVAVPREGGWAQGSGAGQPIAPHPPPPDSPCDNPLACCSQELAILCPGSPAT